MPYVSRDKQGVINGVFTVEQPDIPEEWLAQDDTEVTEFWAKSDNRKGVAANPGGVLLTSQPKETDA